MNAQQQLIAEMRSTASSLRLNGVTANTTHKIAAELIDRAADAMDLMYTPAQMAESFRAGLNTARMESHPPAPGWETAPSGYNYRAVDSDYNATVTDPAVAIRSQSAIAREAVTAPAECLRLKLLNQHSIGVAPDGTKIVPPAALGTHEVHAEAVDGRNDLIEPVEYLLAADAREHEAGVRPQGDREATVGHPRRRGIDAADMQEARETVLALRAAPAMHQQSGARGAITEAAHDVPLALLDHEFAIDIADGSKVVSTPALGALEVHAKAVYIGRDLMKADEFLLATDAGKHESRIYLEGGKARVDHVADERKLIERALELHTEGQDTQAVNPLEKLLVKQEGVVVDIDAVAGFDAGIEIGGTRHGPLPTLPGAQPVLAPAPALSAPQPWTDQVPTEPGWYRFTCEETGGSIERVLVVADRLTGQLLAVDTGVGTLLLQHYHDGLTNPRWQKVEGGA